MRRRISLTLRKELVDEVDRLVDGKKIRNRSHAVEQLIEKALALHSLPAFVLAGSQSVLKNYQGKPVILHALSFLRTARIQDITVVVTAELEHRVRQALRHVPVDYVVQKKKEGTARTLFLLKSQLKQSFIYLYGDNVFDFDLQDLLNFYRASAMPATVALTSTSRPSSYGVVRLKGNRVVAFVEKPREADSYIVSAGLFVFSPQIVNYVRKEDTSLEQDVLKRLIKEGKLAGYVFDGKWQPFEET